MNYGQRRRRLAVGTGTTAYTPFLAMTTSWNLLLRFKEINQLMNTSNPIILIQVVFISVSICINISVVIELQKCRTMCGAIYSYIPAILAIETSKPGLVSSRYSDLRRPKPSGAGEAFSPTRRSSFRPCSKIHKTARCPVPITALWNWQVRDLFQKFRTWFCKLARSYCESQ